MAIYLITSNSSNIITMQICVGEQIYASCMDVYYRDLQETTD